MKIKVILAGAIAMCVLSGCGPQPKPAELIQLEEQRASSESAEINQIAPEAYRKCTELTDKAVDAWQEGEQAQAASYATLGQRQYATARAESQRLEAVSRRQAAEDELNRLKQQIESLKTKQSDLEKSIALKKTSIVSADSSNSEYRIQLAIAEQEKAKGIDADLADESKAIYAQANAKLKAAGESNAYGKREDASKAADEARALFQKAYDTAKPRYDRKMADAAKLEKRKALFEDAKLLVGTNNALTDTKTTTLVFPGAFLKDQTDIVGNKLDSIRRVSELMTKYADAMILIEGYTQKSTKKYADISQRRAEAARDVLISQGVDYKRISTIGLGKDAPRYDEKVKSNRELNDRVEIIITIP